MTGLSATSPTPGTGVGRRPEEQGYGTAPTRTQVLSGQSAFMEGHGGVGVAQLQRQLQILGYLPAEDDGRPSPVDERFGPQTRQAVLNFQRDQGIRQDGIAGQETLGRLRDRVPPFGPLPTAQAPGAQAPGATPASPTPATPPPPSDTIQRAPAPTAPALAAIQARREAAIAAHTEIRQSGGSVNSLAALRARVQDLPPSERSAATRELDGLERAYRRSGGLIARANPEPAATALQQTRQQVLDRFTTLFAP